MARAAHRSRPGTRPRGLATLVTSLVARLAALLAALAALGVAAPAAAQQPGHGADIFTGQGCVGCHGDQGQGRPRVAPALAKNPHLQDADHVLRQILLGRNAMPPFGPILSDEQIAKVASFIRSNWGNSYPPVGLDAVAAIRQTAAAGQPPPQGQPPQQAQNQPQQPQANQPSPAERLADIGGTAGKLMRVPVTGLFPGTVSPEPKINAPVSNDSQTLQRGMDYFKRFNCVGCHADNGAGGMGPALSNSIFIYGHEPAQIYLSILQGRPNGMPAWGGMLPDHIIWDLVAYIQSLSSAPNQGWGQTVAPRLHHRASPGPVPGDVETLGAHAALQLRPAALAGTEEGAGPAPRHRSAAEMSGPGHLRGRPLHPRDRLQHHFRLLEQPKRMPALRLPSWAFFAAALLALQSCQDLTAKEAAPYDGIDPEEGARLIASIGCGGCHMIPGIDGARGLVGPPLDHMGRRVFIAGMLRNTPDNMVIWLMDPQAVVPGNAMPNMALQVEQAQAITNYLYTLK